MTVTDLVGLVRDEVITVGEAHARVRQAPGLLAGADLAGLADAAWQVARTNARLGCLRAGLLYEWAATYGPDDAALFATARAFVRAATEVLSVRDDSFVYRTAAKAADRMIGIAEPPATVDAYYRVGRLHLAPYALDPVEPDDELARGLRRLGERATAPATRIPDQEMPEPSVALEQAVRHLTEAVKYADGATKGTVLAHLAFAELSWSQDGLDRLAEADGYYVEALRHLPTDGDPLARNRLLWLGVLRRLGPPRQHQQQHQLAVPPGVLADGVTHTVLVATTAMRVLSMLSLADQAGDLLRVVWPLVTGDPDLHAQRRFCDLVAAHGLPGDPIGCRARKRPNPPVSSHPASQVHALLCGPGDQADEAAAQADVLAHAPDLVHVLGVVLAERIWYTARTLRMTTRYLPALLNAVLVLAHVGDVELARVALSRLVTVIEGTSPEVIGRAPDDFKLAVLNMFDTVLLRLPESGRRTAVYCVSLLLARWADLRTMDGAVIAGQLMVIMKGRALAGALAGAGPQPPDPVIDGVAADLADVDHGPYDARTMSQARSVILLDDEAVIGTFLHGAERQPGTTNEQRAANRRRQAQATDTARLTARVDGAPRRSVVEIQQALPDGGMLLNLLFGGVGPLPIPGCHVTMTDRDNMAVTVVANERTVAITQSLAVNVDAEPGTDTIVTSALGPSIAALRRQVVADPMHRDVIRAGERTLAELAEYLSDKVFDLVGSFAAAGNTQLICWPHESLHFAPLHLLPYRDGILADYFTVTMLPSVECLFRRPAHGTSGVRAIACAGGGRSVGLPDEPSLHDQAGRIAAAFGDRPLIDATADMALDALGTSRYLHLAAHGAQDVDAPLFARIYLADRPLYAYEIMQRDLRGTDLVTMSACESALLRYDFLDNLHGLAPAFLRAGAGAVIGALWPVAPDVAETFFTQLYGRLAHGDAQVAAFRSAQNHTRQRHPNYRDWSAFTYLGA